MKKHGYKKSTVLIKGVLLWITAAVSFAVIAVTVARYRFYFEGSAVGYIAKPVISVETVSADPLNYNWGMKVNKNGVRTNISYSTPGIFGFNVCNEKDGMIADVAMTYSITITIDSTMTGKGSGGNLIQPKRLCMVDSDNNIILTLEANPPDSSGRKQNYLFRDDKMSFITPGSSEVHSYQLYLTGVPDTANDQADAKISVRVTAEQMNPAAD